MVRITGVAKTDEGRAAAQFNAFTVAGDIPMGRPLKPVDSDQVYKLAKLGCTQAECAEFFGVTRGTIRNRFSREFELGRAVIKKNLRVLQYRRAKQGSDVMLIFLGKQMLDQGDKSGSADLDGATALDAEGRDLDP